MKHIRKYNKLYEQSSNILPVLNETEEEISDYFLDIIDLGYNIVYEKKKISKLPIVEINILYIKLVNTKLLKLIYPNSNGLGSSGGGGCVLFNKLDYIQSVNDCLYSFMKKYESVCKINFYFENNMDLVIICEELLNVEKISINRKDINDIVENNLLKVVNKNKNNKLSKTNDTNSSYKIYCDVDKDEIKKQFISDYNKMNKTELSKKYYISDNLYTYSINDPIILDEIIKGITEDISKYLNKKIDYMKETGYRLSSSDVNNSYLLYYNNLALFSINTNLKSTCTRCEISLFRKKILFIQQYSLYLIFGYN